MPVTTLAVTGHRPQRLGGFKTPNPTYNRVIQAIREEFTELKPSWVVVGMALGVDQWAADLCIEMGIPYVAAVPFKGYDEKWFGASKAKYHYLLSRAYHVVEVSSPGYEPWKLQKRNEYMVDISDMLLAVFDGDERSGTANCIGYALQQRMPIRYIGIDRILPQVEVTFPAPPTPQHRPRAAFRIRELAEDDQFNFRRRVDLDEGDE